jgi:hypothetical protein
MSESAAAAAAPENKRPSDEDAPTPPTKRYVVPCGECERPFVRFEDVARVRIAVKSFPLALPETLVLKWRREDCRDCSAYLKEVLASVELDDLATAFGPSSDEVSPRGVRKSAGLKEKNRFAGLDVFYIRRPVDNSDK